MTMIRLHLRVWLTGPLAPAAAGMVALVLAAALLALWASIRTGIPILNITVTMLLPLALGGSVVTTLLLPARPCGRRVVSAPAGRPCPVRRGPVPAPFKGCGAGTTYAPGRLPYGRAQRPAAARLPTLHAAAGPAYSTGRATVPAGGPL